MADLRKKFKKGNLIMHKYRWKGEPKRDYVYRVDSFRHDGQLIYATLIKVRENSKWKKLPKKEVAFWDFEFRIGPKTPKQGWGKAFKYKGK